MSIFDQDEVDALVDMLEESDLEIALVQTAVVANASQPWKQDSAVPASYPVKAIRASFKIEEISGNIQLGDKKLLISPRDLPALVEPTTADDVIDGGVTYSVEDVRTIKPGAVAMLYVLAAREK